METRIVIITLLNMCTFIVSAQFQLSGTIKDVDDGTPIPYATAALLRPDSSVVTGVMAIDDGTFVIDKVAEGDYIVQVSFLGYEKKNIQVNVPTQSDLGDINLRESAKMLEEVVVTAARPFVTQRLDRIVVNVAGNIITSGLNVNDLLKQLPGLVVDQNGSVKFNGRSAFVYIDGRPTRLPNDQIAQLLNGMQGDVVDRVELITNPSSRFEAGMSEAIVNIRLKRDASLGVNGTIQTGLGFTDYDFYTRDGLNLNYRSKILNIFGNYSYNKMKNYQEIWQKRNYDDVTHVIYDQHSLMRPKSSAHTIRAGIDLLINPKQTVGFLFTGSFSGDEGSFESKADITKSGSIKIDSTIITNTSLTNNYSSQMFNLNYRFAISDGQELTVDADYGLVIADNWQNLQTNYKDANGSELRLPTEFQYNGKRNIDILSFKADYEKQLSEKSRLEAGIKTGKTVTDNDILYENRHNGWWMNDEKLSNRFKYNEAVFAVYATCSHAFGKFSAMAGLRAEHTYIKGESITMDTTFSRSYLDWFPSAYLQYQINNKQGLNLSYSRKINRPGYSALNPFRSYIDPFTIGSGNPDLQPEYRNTLALRYNYGGYSVNFFYSVLRDVFEKEFIQDDSNKTMLITQNNIGNRQAYSINGYAPIKIAKCYTLSAYVQATWNKIDALYNGKPLQKDFLNVNTSLQHALTILPTMRANIQLEWMPRTWSGLIARLDGVWWMNAQIEKTFLDRRLSLTLSGNDLFHTMIWIGKINHGNIKQSFKEDYNNRRTMLTLRYSFGSQQIRGARSRSVGIEEEMGRAR